jgi:hypothetical protein
MLGGENRRDHFQIIDVGFKSVSAEQGCKNKSGK